MHAPTRSIRHLVYPADIREGKADRIPAHLDAPVVCHVNGRTAHGIHPVYENTITAFTQMGFHGGCPQLLHLFPGDGVALGIIISRSTAYCQDGHEKEQEQTFHYSPHFLLNR